MGPYGERLACCSNKFPWAKMLSQNGRRNRPERTGIPVQWIISPILGHPRWVDNKSRIKVFRLIGYKTLWHISSWEGMIRPEMILTRIADPQMGMLYYITPMPEEKSLLKLRFKCTIWLILTLDMKQTMVVQYAPWLKMDVFLCDTVELCKFIKY